MICKLQISQNSNTGKKMMLVYSEDREIFYEDIATEDILKLANGRPKLFVEAKIVNTILQITGEAPDQNW